MDFANTVACPACGVGDALASPVSAGRWFASHGVPVPAGAGGLHTAELRGFRDALRALLNASAARTRPPGRALAAINRASQLGGALPALTWQHGRWTVTTAPTAAPFQARFTSDLARSVVALLTGPERSRLRSCRAPGCAHLVLARTRTQLWCSPTGCGNRVRVARHYQRARSRRSG